MASMFLSLLGSFIATLNDQPIPTFRSNKAQALLIYLAVEQVRSPNAPPRRDVVMELLWPDMPTASARQNLRQTLYLLRQVVPEVAGKGEAAVPLVHSEHQVIQINPDAIIDLDVATFTKLIATDSTQALEQAVALYRGDFLADFYVPDSNDYEDWAANYRTVLRNQVLKALGTLGTRYLEQTRYDLAEQVARRQLELDALRESAHQQLIESLARSGQQSAALAHYEQYVDLLQAELGVEPTLETQQLMLAIREGNLQPVHQFNKLRGYELRETIGEGSFGVVYRAIQPSVGREVAIKAIRSRYADDPDFIRRFETEAQLIARLEHPHIVPLYDYWREPGGAYLVMRWMRGGSVAAAIQNGRFPLDKTVQLIEQIAAALDLAHQHGIVHRDMKPANILLDELGNGYLSDFGIAKDLRASQLLTGSGAILGSPYYLTPEQLRGESVTAQSDIYGLGLVLYELLVGKHPYRESTPAALYAKHLNDPLPAVSEQFSELPAAVDEVIQQATAKAQAHRFRTANEMAQALREAIQGKIPQPRVLPPVFKQIENPYKGLRPFEEADAGRFFGRKRLIDELLSRLAESRFMAIVGPSGSGKSSVVKAGLLPALRQGALPTSGQWFIASMVPGTFPLEELETALLRVAINPPPTLLTQLEASERGLAQTAKRLLPPGESELLLLVDQFEELFTLVTDEERRRFFLNSLVATVNDPRSRVRLLITLRADFYDRPLLYQSFGELVRDHTEAIIPPTRVDLIEAIAEPAKQVGVAVNETLLSAIVNDVYEQPGALPLLQYALTELFDRRQHNEMTLVDYEAIGRMSGALANRAEALYQEQDEAGQAVVQQLFLRLVTLGEEVEDTRRRVLRSELDTIQLNSETVAHTETVALVSKIIEQYGRFRLLSFDHDPDSRAPTVEVAHEALLTAWPRFRDWIATNRDGLRQQRRLQRWATEWETAGREGDLLLRGSRLDQMAGWLTETELALSDNELSFFEASLQARRERTIAEEARRQRELETAQRLAAEEQARANEQTEATKRLRQRASYLVIALVLAGILALIATLLGQQASSNEERAQQNAATAVAEANQRATAQIFAEDQQQLAQAEVNQRATAEAEAILQAQEASEQKVLALAEASQRATAEAIAETERQIAFSRELAAASQASLTQDPELSIMLALEGLNIRHTLAAENALHQALAISRAERTMFGHTSEAVVVAYSPDGTKIISGGSDNTARIWDVASGEELHTFTGYSSSIGGVSFDPSNQRVATSSTDGTVRILDVNSGELQSTLSEGMEWVGEVAFSPDGQRLATSGDQTIIWDLETEEALLTFPDGDGKVAFSPDGQVIATSDENFNVRLYDVVTGKELVVLAGHLNIINGLSFSPDGLLLASEGNDDTVRVWQVDQNSPGSFGQELWTFYGIKSGSAATTVEFTPDGKQILALGADKRVRVWDLATGQEASNFICHLGANGMAISPDGKHVTITVAGVEASIKICRLDTTFEWLTVSGHSDWVYDSDFSPDGNTLYTASRDGTVKGWDVSLPGAASFDQEKLTLASEENRFYDVKVSPDGSSVAAAAFDGTARIWDIVSGQELLTLVGHESFVLGLDFSPDGSRLATASDDGTIRIWDTSNGQQLLNLTGHSGGLWSLDISPDGSMLASASIDTTAKIWDIQSGQELVTLEHPDWLFAVTFSSDGRYLATAGSEGVIDLWDISEVTNGALPEPQRLFGHSGVIVDLAFSPDGSQLASASFDSTVRVWDVATKQHLFILSGHSGNVWGVTFSPDGKHLASTSTDLTTRVYTLDINELIEVAIGRVTRPMTDAECQQYLHLPACPGTP